jgi:hypothetical protein
VLLWLRRADPGRKYENSTSDVFRTKIVDAPGELLKKPQLLVYVPDTPTGDESGRGISLSGFDLKE